MKLTIEEKEVCKKYGEYDENWKVHCYECPLAVDTRYCLCKANLTKKEWQEYIDGG